MVIVANATEDSALSRSLSAVRRPFPIFEKNDIALKVPDSVPEPDELDSVITETVTYNKTNLCI